MKTHSLHPPVRELPGPDPARSPPWGCSRARQLPCAVLNRPLPNRESNPFSSDPVFLLGRFPKVKKRQELIFMWRQPAACRDTPGRAVREGRGRHRFPESLWSRSFLLSRPAPHRLSAGAPDQTFVWPSPGAPQGRAERDGGKINNPERKQRGKRDSLAEALRSGAGVIHLV